MALNPYYRTAVTQFADFARKLNDLCGEYRVAVMGEIAAHGADFTTYIEADGDTWRLQGKPNDSLR